jgi:hypothetical protein
MPNAFLNRMPLSSTAERPPVTWAVPRRPLAGDGVGHRVAVMAPGSLPPASRPGSAIVLGCSPRGTIG